MSSWREVQWVPRTGSTNADLIAAAHAGAGPGLVRIAGQQDSGRGRRGRGWRTDAGAGLAISALLRPDPRTVPARQWPWIPLLGGIAVVDAVEQLRTPDDTGEPDPPVSVKWPNDVLLDGRKLAGILVEHVDVPSSPMVVVGIGINLARPMGLLEAAELALGDDRRGAVVDTVLDTLADRWHQLQHGDVPQLRTAYRTCCDTLGRQVQAHLPSGQTLTGVATGIGPDGCLQVRTANQEVELSAADVVHLRGPDPVDETPAATGGDH